MAKQKIKGLKLSEFAAGPPDAAAPPLNAAKAKLKPTRRREAGRFATGVEAESDAQRAPKRAPKTKAKLPRKKKMAAVPKGAVREPAVGAGRRQGRPAGRLERLEAAIQDVRLGTLASPRTRRLLASGVPKMAQKVIEEAAEAAIEAIRGDRSAFILETVDLFYNVMVLCGGLQVPLSEIWGEMDRRERDLGLAEKMPKTSDGGL